MLPLSSALLLVVTNPHRRVRKSKIDGRDEPRLLYFWSRQLVDSLDWCFGAVVGTGGQWLREVHPFCEGSLRGAGRGTRAARLASGQTAVGSVSIGFNSLEKAWRPRAVNCSFSMTWRAPRFGTSAWFWLTLRVHEDYAVVTPDRDIFIEELSLSNTDLKALRMRGSAGGLLVGVRAASVYALPTFSGAELANFQAEGRRLVEKTRDLRAPPPAPPVAAAGRGQAIVAAPPIASATRVAAATAGDSTQAPGARDLVGPGPYGSLLKPLMVCVMVSLSVESPSRPLRALRSCM